ncbi:MAG: aminopeptidase, partial [Thermoleophilia bacterium]|nr:aminopeptidase [Thermoleophilia bacterium]
MKDPRLETLARNLLDYSLEIQPGEKLLIEGEPGSEDLVVLLVEEAYRRQALPFVQMGDARVQRAWLMAADRGQLALQVDWELYRAKDLDAVLYVLAGDNASELADVPGSVLEASRLAARPLKDLILQKKWCLLRYPTPAAAQAAGMSTQAFEDLCLAVSTLDYARMDAAMDPLVALMEQTDQVRITGPGTDLTFSIKGIPVQKAAGKNNIPDGEVFTAPVRDSVEGVVLFNAPSLEEGTTFERVRLVFKAGRIVEADSNEREKMVQILDTDEGARYLGEFALGLNPHIHRPMKDTLWDEKIRGSLHLTPGRAYEDADNGNRSSVHWDL